VLDSLVTAGVFAALGLLAGHVAIASAWFVLRLRGFDVGPASTFRYPAVLLYLAVAYASVTLSLGLGAQTIELLALLFLLAVVTVTDLKALLIPNGCIIAAAFMRFIYLGFLFVTAGQSVALEQLVRSLVGAGVVGCFLGAVILLMDRVLGKESMGGGDLKLFVLAGLFFGWEQCVVLVAFACAAGLVFAVWWERATRYYDRASGPGTFPFAPAIALAFWMTMLWGDWAVQSYLDLLIRPLF